MEYRQNLPDPRKTILNKSPERPHTKFWNKVRVEVSGWRVQYAIQHDIGICCKNNTSQRQKLATIQAAKEVGLKINELKTDTLSQTRENISLRQTQILRNDNLENVDRSIYLEMNFIADGDGTAEAFRQYKVLVKGKICQLSP